MLFCVDPLSRNGLQESACFSKASSTMLLAYVLLHPNKSYMKNKLIFIFAVGTLISACSVLKPKPWVQNDTELLGDSAQSLDQLYGKYKVIDRDGRGIEWVDSIIVVRMKDKPVFVLVDKEGKEGDAISPRKCEGRKKDSSGSLRRAGIACGNISDNTFASMMSYEPMILLSDTPFEDEKCDIFSKCKTFRIAPGEYGFYISWIRGPHVHFELQRIDEKLKQ
jgi:hypothetical protein